MVHISWLQNTYPMNCTFYTSADSKSQATKPDSCSRFWCCNLTFSRQRLKYCTFSMFLAAGPSPGSVLTLHLNSSHCLKPHLDQIKFTWAPGIISSFTGDFISIWMFFSSQAELPLFTKFCSALIILVTVHLHILSRLMFPHNSKETPLLLISLDAFPC